MRRAVLGWIAAALLVAGGCGGEAEGDGNNGASWVNNGANNGGLVVLPQPACVWNQAYQENFQPDSVSAILQGAQGCYVLLDPFDSAEARAAIPDIQAAGNVVGCYISVGTCEEWRDDFAAMQRHCVDRAWGDWEGEYFVDDPNPELLTLMRARVDRMAAWGCDMVEFDNMDWALDDQYRRQYGFSATPADAEAYNAAICDHVVASGMQCMGKNMRDRAGQFAAGTYESYPGDPDWWVHDHLQSVLNDGGLGIVIHYGESDCDGAYARYRAAYGDKLSFLCEDNRARGYRHYNP